MKYDLIAIIISKNNEENIFILKSKSEVVFQVTLKCFIIFHLKM